MMRRAIHSDTLGGMRLKQIFLGSATVVLLAPFAAACGGSSTSSETTEPAGVVELTPAARLIDVRTPAEFAEGYVKGAVNIDVSAADFEAQIASLDKTASYNVYCRSGNRSATAVEIMRNAGFTNVTDLGAVQEAAEALSLPVVTE